MKEYKIFTNSGSAYYLFSQTYTFIAYSEKDKDDIWLRSENGQEFCITVAGIEFLPGHKVHMLHTKNVAATIVAVVNYNTREYRTFSSRLEHLYSYRKVPEKSGCMSGCLVYLFFVVVSIILGIGIGEFFRSEILGIALAVFGIGFTISKFSKNSDKESNEIQSAKEDNNSVGYRIPSQLEKAIHFELNSNDKNYTEIAWK